MRRRWSRRVLITDEAERAQHAVEVIQHVESGLDEIHAVLPLSGFVARAHAERRNLLEAVQLDADKVVRKPLQEDWLPAQEEFERFRAKEGIERDPERYRDRAPHLWAIAVALLVDFAIHAVAYGRAEASILLGAVPAFIPAFLTGLCAYLAVWNARYTLRRDWRLRAAGAIGAGITGCFAVFCLLGAAHYRDRLEALQMGTPYPADAASFLQHLLGAPLSLTDLSLWLFLLSLGGLAFTVFHFWFADDAIAGHGARARRIEAAAARVAEGVAAIQREIKGAIDGNTQSAEHRLHTHRSKLNAMVSDIKAALLHLGIVDPDAEGPGDTENPAVRALLKKYGEVIAWRQMSFAMGDIRVALTRRKDDEDPSAEPEMLEVERLTEAITAEEGWDWLDRMIQAWGVKDDDPETGGGQEGGHVLA